MTIFLYFVFKFCFQNQSKEKSTKSRVFKKSDISQSLMDLKDREIIENLVSQLGIVDGTAVTSLSCEMYRKMDLKVTKQQLGRVLLKYSVNIYDLCNV